MKRHLAQLLACLLVCFGIPALRAQDTSFATLRLTSEPVATFTLNNATLKTGLNVTQQVPSDTPLLLKVSAPGYQTQYKRLVLGAGERHHESFKLLREPIPVLFRSNTTATVLCNGAELGTTPFHTFFNEPKTYRIIIRAPGFQEQTLNLNLANGRPRVIDCSLLTESGTVEVSSEPSGAQISINGIERGVTPATLSKLREGKHILRLKLGGYKPVTHTFSISAGDTVPLLLRMERLPSGLSITTLPTGARVYVDGVFRGESDLSVANLPEGAHQIRIEKPGYQEETRFLSLRAGETHVEEFRLNIVRGTLAVRTQPAQVRVYAGKHLLLTTSPAKKDDFTSAVSTLQLPPGRHTLTLKADGYATTERTINISANQTTSLNVRLDFKANFELRTKSATYRGVFVRQTKDNTTTIELKPGSFRSFKQEEILEQHFLKEEP